jgi:hypothetical protein
MVKALGVLLSDFQQDLANNRTQNRTPELTQTQAIHVSEKNPQTKIDLPSSAAGQELNKSLEIIQDTLRDKFTRNFVFFWLKTILGFCDLGAPFSIDNISSQAWNRNTLW